MTFKETVPSTKPSSFGNGIKTAKTSKSDSSIKMTSPPKSPKTLAIFTVLNAYFTWSLQMPNSFPSNSPSFSSSPLPKRRRLSSTPPR